MDMQTISGLFAYTLEVTENLKENDDLRAPFAYITDNRLKVLGKCYDISNIFRVWANIVPRVQES